jgi:hypothetical protein
MSYDNPDGKFYVGDRGFFGSTATDIKREQHRARTARDKRAQGSTTTSAAEQPDIRRLLFTGAFARLGDRIQDAFNKKG